MERRSGHATPPTYRVRVAKDFREAAAAGELLKAFFDARNRATPAYREHLRDMAPRLSQATLLVVVDEDDDDRVVGTATFCLAGTTYAFASREGEAEMRMVATEPAERDGGLVDQLITEECIRRAEEAGADALVLSTSTDEPPPAKYFRRRGFRKESTRTLSPAPGISLVVWRLDLPAGPYDARPASPMARFMGRRG